MKMVSDPIKLPDELLRKMEEHPEENWVSFIEEQIKLRLENISADGISYNKLVQIIDKFQLGEISFGKAVEMSGLGNIGFAKELEKRGILRNPGYSEDGINRELELLDNLS